MTPAQVAQFHESGFIFFESLFLPAEIELMNEEFNRLSQVESPARILEKSGAIRSIFGCHASSAVYTAASKVQRLVTMAEQLLDSPVYIHQSKINCKQALVGDWWEWHQDFPYWHREDGMLHDRVLTICIYLTDVDEFNGPLLVIPGSHRDGIAQFADKESGQGENQHWYARYQKSTSYMSALTSDLKYTIEPATLKKWVDQNGIVSLKGPAGSVLAFHGNLFHASNHNLSPYSRDMCMFTYNSTHNAPAKRANPRPEFLSGTNYAPIAALPDDALRNVARTSSVNEFNLSAHGA
jgi:ectoine hydroxylase